MCLGELGQVLDLDAGGTAHVRVGERSRTVSLLTLDVPVAVDDWVLVHAGFALARLTADDAREAERIRAGTDPDEVACSADG